MQINKQINKEFNWFKSRKLVLEHPPNIWHWGHQHHDHFVMMSPLQRVSFISTSSSSWTHLVGCSFDEHVDPQVLQKCWKPFCFCELQVSPLQCQSWCWSLHLVDGEPWNKHKSHKSSHLQLHSSLLTGCRMRHMQMGTEQNSILNYSMRTI